MTAKVTAISVYYRKTCDWGELPPHTLSTACKDHAYKE